MMEIKRQIKRGEGRQFTVRLTNQEYLKLKKYAAKARKPMNLICREELFRETSQLFTIKKTKVGKNLLDN